MDAKRAGLRELLENDWPMTCRQTFYRAVSAGLVEKTEGAYKNTVIRLLVEMRRSGEIPYNRIADNTRWMRKPQSHDSLEAALHNAAISYRRSVWNDQPEYVELWSEKDALAGVIYEVTAEWDVPLLVTRGYPSITYLYEAAANIAAQGKPATIYYCGDHDPSGIDIERFAREQIVAMAPDVKVRFQRLAVLPEQIDEYDLPLRPTKKTDSRSKNFRGGSVEVDAIPPRELRRIVRDAIESHVDPDVHARMRQNEQQERDTLRTIAARTWRIA